MTWIPAVPEVDLAPGTVHALDGVGPEGRLDLVVWRTASGVVVACDARCPHQWSHLQAEGVVDGDELVCTAHFWRFAPDGTGTKVNVKRRRDRKAPVQTHPVRILAGVIEVELPDDGAARGTT